MKYDDFFYSIIPGVLIALLSVLAYTKFGLPLWVAMTGVSVSILVAIGLFLQRMR